MHNHASQYTRGQAMLIAVVVFLSVTAMIAGSVAVPTLAALRAISEANKSGNGFFAAEGLLEDAIYRVKNGMDIDVSETMTIVNGATATATIAAPLPDERLVTVGGEYHRALRRTQARLVVGAGASFNFGVQTDTGGIVLQNSSSVRGNVYANGAVTGSGSNIIRGDVVSAGPTGTVSGVNATGTAYAHTITGSDIDGDAYYVSISSTVVGGIQYPGSPDQPVSELPISNDQIDEWENDAEAGGTLVCNGGTTHTISSSVTIGPIKIPCNLEIQGNGTTLTLNGTVWVVGNITTRNSPTIRVAPAVGNKSVPVVADNPALRATTGTITLENSVSFDGSGGANSYVLLVSRNTSARNGGAVRAINIRNSVAGDLLVYAGDGEILLENSVDLKEVTAYRVRLQNSAEVIYESGLASLLFTSGPGGSFAISEWQEIE